MKTEIYQKVTDLQERYQTLSEFEALQIATKMQELEVFARAHSVVPDGSTPSALQSIANCLGASRHNPQAKTITHILADLGVALTKQ